MIFLGTRFARFKINNIYLPLLLSLPRVSDNDIIELYRSLLGSCILFRILLNLTHVDFVPSNSPFDEGANYDGVHYLKLPIVQNVVYFVIWCIVREIFIGWCPKVYCFVALMLNRGSDFGCRSCSCGWCG